MPCRWISDHLPPWLRAPLKNAYRRFVPPPTEPLMYRVHLFEEAMALAGRDAFRGKRILEIGPRDGLDSKRLAELGPAELVMIELPEKREATAQWLGKITCPHRYIEANLMYMPEQGLAGLGSFDLIWCTGVLYHNAEQLRFLRKLYKLLNVGGRLVLESSTLRGPRRIREGSFVQIHYPETFRDTGTVTHLPTARAIKAWLRMVGFTEVRDSRCFEKDNRDLLGLRMACIATKECDEAAGVYYGKSGLNEPYVFGESV
jgi:2-polyprenyl-3-methyl-5-hydroxy-6-metoxy-1,4-benzoquinol methylase